LTIPYLIGRTVERCLVHGGLTNLAPLIASLELILALGLARLGFGFMQIHLLETTANKVIASLREGIYRHLQGLSFSYFDRVPTGDLMSRLTQDMEFVRNFLAFGVSHGIALTGITAVVITMLFVLDWQLALIYLILLPPVLFIVRRFGRGIHRGVLARQEQVARMNVTVQENIAGVRAVRAFGAEGVESARFWRENDLLRQKNMAVMKLHAFYGPLFAFCAGLGALAVIWFGGRQVIAGHAGIGVFVSFYFYLGLLNWPINALGPTINLWKQAEGSAARLAEILDAGSDIVPPASPVDLGRIKGVIRFEHVSFSYGEEQILTDISFTAAPGQRVAILGLTGSGKTTLVNLIPRFYDPTAGAITIDGHDLRLLDLHRLRGQIGTVLQETFLFSTTIGANIAFGRPGAEQAEIEEAANAARIHDFIAGLPKGYDTIIGERGIGLSGGQRQRLALARAILMNPRILILDDATASVDMETEQAIQKALDRLAQGRTTFVITQRVSTARQADLIIVLEDGRLIDGGDHENLLKQNRFYRELYKLQVEAG
jgi:ATP-binding cassette subfamily B protein